MEKDEEARIKAINNSKNSDNEENKGQEVTRRDMKILNLLSQIIVEIILKESYERNRICKDK